MAGEARVNAAIEPPEPLGAVLELKRNPRLLVPGVRLSSEDRRSLAPSFPSFPRQCSTLTNCRRVLVGVPDYGARVESKRR